MQGRTVVKAQSLRRSREKTQLRSSQENPRRPPTARRLTSPFHYAPSMCSHNLSPQILQRSGIINVGTRTHHRPLFYHMNERAPLLAEPLLVGHGLWLTLLTMQRDHSEADPEQLGVVVPWFKFPLPKRHYPQN